ncbi:TIGR04211 family SH3 domain-containing protein [Spongiibacter nanhainus]|uniref:TIGR04211 family SH3 domain-containing protein n=1 Tax=Spongiibacter nanhainus TaxID=2794344 RepID=A0A7T4URJ2_9GAMM|nr:TIGR04211 family SH3 domain-containing protein [Spongiibacter nanhainus]QQD19791.1 TIGR04211 family SH3 domain-containing protein [Spongiibacter nanhainus]
MKKLFPLLVLCFATLAAAQAWSQTRYITDTVYVPLRVGNTTKHRIVHRGLPSGTELQVINSEGDWSQVRTKGGLEGWLPSHYLDESPAAKTQLRAAHNKVVELTEANRELQDKLANSAQASQQNSSVINELKEENSALAQELEEIKRISSNAIKLDEENRRLLESNQLLSSEVDVLRTDNARLRENKENEFFLNGAFAVLIGVMITLIVPRMMPKKRSEWV